MTSFVIDSCAVAEVLMKTQLGNVVSRTIRNCRLFAPELMDAEVLATLRRAVNRKTMTERDALIAVDLLSEWPITRLSHAPFNMMVWGDRHNVSPYDALYLAVARVLELPLITIDARLSRAPVTDVSVIDLR